MFRRAVLDVILSPESRCLRICADRYLFNFSHAVGGSLIIRTVHGCYRRHATNGFSSNPVVGGDSFLGDNSKDPAAVANALIFQHVLAALRALLPLAWEGVLDVAVAALRTVGRVVKA